MNNNHNNYNQGNKHKNNYVNYANNTPKVNTVVEEKIQEPIVDNPVVTTDEKIMDTDINTPEEKIMDTDINTPEEKNDEAVEEKLKEAEVELENMKEFIRKPNYIVIAPGLHVRKNPVHNATSIHVLVRNTRIVAAVQSDNIVTCAESGKVFRAVYVEGQIGWCVDEFLEKL